MQIIKETIEHNLDLKDYRLDNACFLDIETTGLNRDRDMVYLIGIIYKSEKNNWIVKQVFANSIKDEKHILKLAIKFLNKFTTIINYNGDTFDLPFINSRAKYHKLNELINIHNSLDIYKFLRKNKDLLDIKNLKLKTVENYLGYNREDIYSGYDCIKFYKDYIVNNDKKSKSKVLKHNFDDLYQMLNIIEIIKIINNKKTISLENKNIEILDYKIIKDHLYIEGSIYPSLKYNISDFNKYYSFKTYNLKIFKLKLNILEGYISDNTLAIVIDTRIYSLNINKSSKYNIPNYILPIKIKNKYMFENIKLFLINFLNLLL